MLQSFSCEEKVDLSILCFDVKKIEMHIFLKLSFPLKLSVFVFEFLLFHKFDYLDFTIVIKLAKDFVPLKNQ
jgi:hypothetical protein